MRCSPSRAEGEFDDDPFKAGLIQTNVSNEMAENVAFVRAAGAASRAMPAPTSS